MSEIRYIISDLDGTLVDTFEANFLAYQKVLFGYGIALKREIYRQAFGLRISEFLSQIGLELSAEDLQILKKAKAECYPEFFPALRLNRNLADFLAGFKRQSGHTALVSTASLTNIENVLNFLQVHELFDFIISGEEVHRGKPDPECYLLAQKHWGVPAGEILVFEDSEVGIQAAQAAGMNVIRIGVDFYV